MAPVKVRATVLALACLLLGGCSSPPAATPDQPDGPRESEGTGDGPGWTLGGCEHFLFQVRVPATQLRPLVPERHDLYEFPPGVAYAGILTTACQNATLEDGSALPEVRQAALGISIDNGTGVDHFLLEWVVSDPAFARALAVKGFTTLDGDLVVGDSDLPAGGFQRTTVQATAEKGSVQWHGEARTTSPFPNTHSRWVQDQAGTDVILGVVLPTSYAADGLNDQCALEAADPLWKAALDPGVLDCTPFGVAGDIGFRFAEADPDASR